MTDRIDLTNPAESPTPRREFLGQIAASAMVLAGTACTPAAIAQSGAVTAPAPSRGTSSQTWDDSWTTRLTAKHKAVFDSPDVAENATLGFLQANRYVMGARDALGLPLNAIQTVVVVRHKSIPFAFNDAMWAKYGLGEQAGVKTDGVFATANPLAHARQKASDDRPQGNIEWMTTHGSFVLACDLATQGWASELASKRKLTMKEVYEELKANLAPGVILQPNGVYAVLRAQEAGCVYMRSS